MARIVLILTFAGFIAYGAWNGCSDSMQNQRAANHERIQLLDSI